jgi:hypothetical protein
MSTNPSDDMDDGEREADRQADAMKARLREDVASWSAERGEAPLRHEPKARVPAAKQASATPRVKKVKQAAQPLQPAEAVKKPFSMSYDGVTTAEHIRYMMDRGAR